MAFINCHGFLMTIMNGFFSGRRTRASVTVAAFGLGTYRDTDGYELLTAAGSGRG